MNSYIAREKNIPELKGRILVFSYSSKNESLKETVYCDFTINKWMPSLFCFIPPNSSVKYFFAWVAYFLHIFKNTSYFSNVIYSNKKLICSLVCIPGLFIWPFMGKNDIQIKNVFTHRDFRRRGLAQSLLKYTIEESIAKNTVIWYLTHDNNIPSINLCRKLGFEYKGYFKKSKKWHDLIKRNLESIKRL
jgi:GNAT superfamily N-acetyltransferase